MDKPDGELCIFCGYPAIVGSVAVCGVLFPFCSFCGQAGAMTFSGGRNVIERGCLHLIGGEIEYLLMDCDPVDKCRRRAWSVRGRLGDHDSGGRSLLREACPCVSCEAIRAGSPMAMQSGDVARGVSVSGTRAAMLSEAGRPVPGLMAVRDMLRLSYALLSGTSGDQVLIFRPDGPWTVRDELARRLVKNSRLMRRKPVPVGGLAFWATPTGPRKAGGWWLLSELPVLRAIIAERMKE